MMSLKKIIKIIIAFIFLVIILSFFVNIYIQKGLKSIDYNEKIIDNTRSEYSLGYESIRILKTIIVQEVISDSEKENDLRDEYNARKDSLLVNNQKMLANINTIDISNLHPQYLSKLFDGFEDLETNIQIAKEKLQKLEEEENKLGIFKDRNMEQINLLEAYYVELEDIFSNLHTSYTNYVTKISSVFMMLFYVLFGLLTILLLISLLIIRRLYYKNLSFLMNVFENIENNNYYSLNKQKFMPLFEEEIITSKVIDKIIKEKIFSTEFKNKVIKTYIMDDVIDLLYEHINKVFKVDRVGIAFVDYKNNTIVAEYAKASYDNIQLGTGFFASIDSSSLSQILRNKKGVINNDLLYAYNKKPNSVVLRLIISEGIKSNMVVPLIYGENVFGFVFFSSTSINHFNEDYLKLATKMIYEVDGYLNRAYLMKMVLVKITNTFSDLVDRKDNDTGSHIIRMVKYSVIIAESLNKRNIKYYEVSEKMVLDIERNASAHDIGKVGIPDSILKKPDKFTTEEYDIMKTHTTIGGDIFKELRKGMSIFDYDFYSVAENIATYHHEKWDGTGYPKGLKGREIPIEARIVAIADVFDALTSKRVYKDAYSFEEALKIIQESKGKHFDPVIVDVFLESIEKVREIYKGKYNN